MKTLKRKQRNRKIYYMHTIVGLTYKEIGQIYGLTQGTIGRIVKEVRGERKGVTK